MLGGLLRRKPASTDPTDPSEPELLGLADLAGGARAIQIWQEAQARLQTLGRHPRDPSSQEVQATAMWRILEALATGAEPRPERPAVAPEPDCPTWALPGVVPPSNGSPNWYRIGLVRKHGWTWPQALSLSGGEAERAHGARQTWDKFKLEREKKVAAKHAERAPRTVANASDRLRRELQSRVDDQRHARTR